MATKRALALSCCIVALFAERTEAQTAPADPTAAATAGATDSGATDTGEIVVTARRRAESIQKVPISITAVTGDTLKSQGIQDLKTFSSFVPGVNINNGRPDGGGTTAQIFIRGVGQNDFLIPNEPGVGLYVDDVYVASSSGALNTLGDVASIEVLRGPQGTLYGKNTIGGAIRITTVKPQLGELSGNGTLTLGSFNRLDLQAGMNVPLGDTVALRVSAISRNADDLQRRPLDPSENGQGNIDQQAARGVLLWKPDAAIEVTLSGDYTRIRQHMGYGGNIQYVPGGSPLVDALNAQYYPRINASLGLPADSRFDGRWATAPGDVGATGPNADHYDVWGLSGIVDVELGNGLSVKSITAYRAVKGFAGRDGDSSPYAITETVSRDDNWQFSQEVQLNGSSFEERFKWTTGLYYMKQKLRNRIVTKLWDGLIDTTINIDFNARSDSRLSGDSYAVFGQGTFDITPQLHLTAGARYNIEKREFLNDWFFLVQPRRFTCPGQDVTGAFIQCKSTDKVFTPAVSLSYDLTRDAMIYASYSDGFKVGGWTPRLFSQQSLKRYLPERLKAYELGLKTSWFDRRLTFNIDVFQSDYTNLQLTSVLADSNGSPQPVVQNAGSARIRGVEADATLRLGGTRIQGGLSYLDGEYRRLDPGVSFPLSAELPETPKLSLNGSIDHVVDFSNGASGLIRIDATYRSKTYKDPNNVEAIAQRPYVLMNGRLAYTLPGGKVTLARFVTNITDKRYIVSALDIASTFSEYEAYFGRPREFGIELGVRY